MQFTKPIVSGEELAITAIRSQDYVEAASGWRVARDGSAQFSSINALGDFGTSGQISGYSAQIGDGGLFLSDGTDVGAAITNLIAAVATPNLLIAYGDVGAIAGSIGGATGQPELPCMELQWVQPVTCMMMIMYKITLTTTVAEDTLFSRLHFTTDGSLPTVSSALLDQQMLGNVNGAGRWISGTAFYISQFTSGVTYRLLTSALRGNGTGTISVPSGAHRHQMAAIRLSSQNVANTLIDRGTVTSPPPPAPVPQNYQWSYSAQWSRTYDGDNTTTWDDSNHCYQGYYDSNRNNTRSLVGFSYTAIQSDLSGASNIVVKLKFKVLHSYYDAGATIIIGGHNYTSKPSTWSGGTVTENLSTKTSAKAGSTYTVTLPSTFATNFKNGTFKGIAFGPGPSNSHTYYAYLAGALEVGQPQLIISYTK